MILEGETDLILIEKDTICCKANAINLNLFVTFPVQKADLYLRNINGYPCTTVHVL